MTTFLGGDPLRAIRKALSSFEFHRRETDTAIIAAWSFDVEVQEDELDGGFVVHSPNLRGCWSQGETREEALTNFHEAVDLWLESRLADSDESATRDPASPVEED